MNLLSHTHSLSSFAIQGLILFLLKTIKKATCHMDIVWLCYASSSLTPSTTARKRVIFCCCLYALHRLFSLLLILGSLFRMNRALIVNGRANETSWACFNNVCLLFWRKIHFTYQMRVQVYIVLLHTLYIFWFICLHPFYFAHQALFTRLIEKHPRNARMFLQHTI